MTVVLWGGYLIKNQLIDKIISLSLTKFLQIIYSSTGLIMLFILVGTAIKRNPAQLPQWIIKAGGLCMGVYLLQQFILVALYEHTLLPAMLGCWLLPWVGFVVTLLGSSIIVLLLLKTKIGKFLLG